MSEPPSAETVFEGKFLRFRKTGTWEFVERMSGHGVVVILPITRGGTLILVEQFRAAVGRNVVEFPAGLAGDEEGRHGENLLAAAKRELLEETNYEAAEWKWLGEGPSSAGLTNEMITFFLARNVTPGPKQQPQPNEKIEVHEVPMDALSAWIEKKRQGGCLIDYKIFAALYLLG